MDILLVITLCCVFYMGYVLGSQIAYFKISRVIAKMDKINNGLKNISTTVTYLETEVHGDMIYLYDKEHKDFICQAKSIEELAKLAKEFKQIDIAVVLHGDRVFMFNGGKSQEKTIYES